jgi:hypothetical protein
MSRELKINKQHTPAVEPAPVQQNTTYHSEKESYKPYYDEGWHDMNSRVIPGKDSSSTETKENKADKIKQTNDKAAELIKAHTDMLGMNLNEESLGAALTDLALTDPATVLAVMYKLDSEDRDDVAAVVVECLGKKVVNVNKTLLREFYNELNTGMVTPSEYKLVRLIGTIIGENDPKDVNAGAGNLSPATSDHLANLKKRMDDPRVMAMLTGLSTVGNKLYGETYRPTAVLKLTEDQKQKIFKESSDKTLAILMSEFVEGHGLQSREFGPETPVTKKIKYSYTTSLFIKAVVEGKKKGKYKEGVKYKMTIFTSPDNADQNPEGLPKPNEIAINALKQGVDNLPAFFTGSLDYEFTMSGKTIIVKAHNEYSIASGVTRNDDDDLHRTPGHLSPLGNTDQYFNFTINESELTQ